MKDDEMTNSRRFAPSVIASLRHSVISSFFFITQQHD